MTKADPIAFQVILDRSWDAHAHIYEPMTGYPDASNKKFCISLQPEAIPEHLRSQMYVNDRGIVSANSNHRPEVIASDIHWLVAALQRLDARNLPRDRIFRGEQLVVKLKAYRYADLYPHHGNMLGSRFKPSTLLPIIESVRMLDR